MHVLFVPATVYVKSSLSFLILISITSIGNIFWPTKTFTNSITISHNVGDTAELEFRNSQKQVSAKWPKYAWQIPVTDLDGYNRLLM